MAPSAASSATRVARQTTGTAVRRPGSGSPACGPRTSSSPSTKKTPAHEQSSRPASSETVERSWSSASGDTERLAVLVRNRDRPACGAVDEDESLVRGDEERPVRDVESGELERDARAPDPRNSDVNLDLVIEACGREVLDVVGAHHELAAAVSVKEPKRAEILAAREIEVRVVTAVVHDALRVGVRERDARPNRECVVLAHVRITASTLSRFSSISFSEVASRLRRRSGSVLDGRTLKCHSPASTDRPSRWDTVPSFP